MTPRPLDVVLLAVYFTVTAVALLLMGFPWAWAVPLAVLIAAAAWALGRMSAPD